MDSWRIRMVAGLAGGLLVAGTAGCARPAGQASGARQTSMASATVRSSSAAGAVTADSARSAPKDLAPAGPAPGAAAPLAEGEGQLAAGALAQSVGCVELEPQAHVAAVDQQVSCRRGIERTYLMTFRSTADLDGYLAHGPQVVSGGFNVIGANFVVHVVTLETARTLAAALPGLVRPGS